LPRLVRIYNEDLSSPLGQSKGMGQNGEGKEPAAGDKDKSLSYRLKAAAFLALSGSLGLFAGFGNALAKVRKAGKQPPPLALASYHYHRRFQVHPAVDK